MKNLRRISFLLMTCLLIYSCNRDNELASTDPILTPMDTETYTSGHLNGHIIGEDNAGISDALVEVNGEQTQTDANGFFRFKDIQLSTNGTLVKVSKDGYFDGFKFGYVQPDQNSMIKVKLIPSGKVREFESSTGAIIALGSGSELSIPPASISTESGTLYNGNTIVRAHWYDPRSSELAESMPGDLRGLREDGTAAQLTSYGMMAVHLEAEDGSKLKLKEGTTARLTFPLPSGANIDDMIPMWHLDETSGVWKEEGSAFKEGDAMIAEVSHFSFWNCDVPFDAVRIKGTLITVEGIPITDQIVTITDLDNNISGIGFTNELGTFSGFVPAGVELLLSFESCEPDPYTQNLGILQEDKDLGVIEVDLYTLRLEGLLTVCNRVPYDGAYLILTTSRGIQILSPRIDGKVDFSFLGCENETITFIGVDTENLLESDLITHEYSTQEHNFGTLAICDNELTQEITFSNNGGTPVILDDAEVLLLNGTHVAILVEDNPPNYLKFVYPLDLVNGLFPYWQLEAANSDGNVQGAHVDPRYFDFEVVDVLTSDIGDVVIGSAQANAVPTSLDFKLKIDGLVETGTVEGRIWTDTNANGLYDTGEPGVGGLSIEIESVDSDQIVASYFAKPGIGFASFFHSEADGKFRIEAIVPDGEYQLVFGSSTAQVTTPDAGDDTIDSDFIQKSPGSWTYKTDPFTISSGELIGNFGLGLLP